MNPSICSNALLLAGEIQDDVMAGKEEIATAIEFGFVVREKLMKDRIIRWLREQKTVVNMVTKKTPKN